MFLTLACALLVSLLCSVQGTVYVDANAGSSSNVGTVQSPFLTLQQGLSAIGNGGQVIVNDGLYKGVGNKNLSIASQSSSITSLNGPNKTIIDCEGSGYAFEVFSAGSVTFTGFTIRNCYRHAQNVSNVTDPTEGNYGGGAFSIHSTDTILNNLILQNNSATGFGGAIYVFSSSFFINNSTIQNNQVTGIGGAIYIQSANLQLNNGTIISNNKASQNGSDVFCVSASIQLLDNASQIATDSCISCSITRNGTSICPKNTNGSVVGVTASYVLMLAVAIVSIMF